MDITLLYFPDCPNWKVADERLQSLAVERDDIRVIHRLVETPADAQLVGFQGSPSIQVDGVDVFAETDGPVGLACRRYATPDGVEGAPTLEQLRKILARA